MSEQSITRRRFLIVGGVAVGGALAAAATWLTRADGSPAAGSTTSTVPADPTSTSPASTTSSTTTSAVPTTTATAPPATTSTEPDVELIIPVICKEAWGAKSVAGDFTPHTIERITVHHTAVALSSNIEGPARARQHQSYHQDLGWPDLAYHYLIDANGHVYEGRPVDAVGDTATDYDPTGHLLICCEGDFNSQQITADQYDSLIRMLAWGASEFGIDPTAIRGHREIASTTCPGDNLYALMADGTVSSDVAAIVAQGDPELDVACGPAATDAIAAIEAGEI
jgi:hypothetical protein